MPLEEGVPNGWLHPRATTEPDDVRLIRALRELEAERTARKKAEKHAKILSTRLATANAKLHAERHAGC